MPTHAQPKHTDGGFVSVFSANRIPCLEPPLSATDSKSQSNPCPYLHPAFVFLSLSSGSPPSGVLGAEADAQRRVRARGGLGGRQPPTTSEGGRVGPTNADSQPGGHRPASTAQPPPRCGSRACPYEGRGLALLFRRGPRPTFRPRPPTYALFAFSGHFKASKMWVPRLPLRQAGGVPCLMPGSYDLFALVDLSVAHQTLSGQQSSRHGEAAKKRSHNSIQLKPCPPACYNDPSASSGPPTRRWHT